MQKRDVKSSIYFPGLWGLFGGACEQLENPNDAIYRELSEELGVNFSKFEYFFKMEISSKDLGVATRERFFYKVAINEYQISSINLTEGESWKFFTADDSLKINTITPFDLAAINLFIHTDLQPRQIKPL